MSRRGEQVLPPGGEGQVTGLSQAFLTAALDSPELMGDPIEDPVDEAAAVFGSVALRDLDRLIEDSPSGGIFKERELISGDPKDISIDRVHPVELPV